MERRRFFALPRVSMLYDADASRREGEGGSRRSLPVVLFLGVALLIGMYIASVLSQPPSSLGAVMPAVPVDALTPSAFSNPVPISSAHTLSFARTPAGNFSSFECSAGSQVFEVPLQNTQGPEFPAADAVFMRTCLLRDVCMVGGRLTYFVDAVLDAATPPNCRISAMTTSPAGFVLPSYLKGHLPTPVAYSPDLVVGPRPPALPFAPTNRTFMLGELSHAENFGHLLIDNILPAYAAADAFGFSMDDVQLISLADCHGMETGGATNPSGASNADDCARNLERWFVPLVPYPFLSAPAMPDQCFERLVLGHELVFSLAGMFLHRSSAIRAARSRLYSAMGISPLFAGAAHTIVVLEKKPQYAPIDYPGMCQDVQAWAQLLDPSPPVHCFRPADLSVAEQLAFIARSSLVVAEHGSTTYMSLFQVPGSSLLVIVPFDDREAKEVQVLLYNTDVQAWYLRRSQLIEGGQGPGALLMALERAGRRLSLPPIALREGG